MNTDDKKDITRDSIFNGRITLNQSVAGYRFTEDSLFLIWFASQVKKTFNVVDLGAGCGVVGLGLSATGRVKKVTAVEVQPLLADLAKINARENGLEDEFDIFQSDISRLGDDIKAGSADLVVSNPPFWPAGEGRLPPEESRRLACHEILITLDGWIETAARLMNKQRGCFCIIFPSKRLDTLINTLAKKGLSPTRLCFVHPTAHAPAALVMVEANFGHTGRINVMAPLILKDNGQKTRLASSIFDGSFISK